MSKAEDRKGAYGNAVDVTDIINFSLTSSSKTTVLPRGLYGQWIRMRPIGANMNYAFSHVATIAIAASPAATDNGATHATQGEYVPDGELVEVRVPYATSPNVVYFSRFGSAADQAVQVMKASGKGGLMTIED